MSSIMILLALAGGAMLSMQAAINGRLGSQVGVFRSAFLTFSVGALITALLIFYFAPHQTTTLLDVPKWQLLGAFCGVPYMGNDAITFSPGRLGAIVCLGLALFFIYRSGTAAKAAEKR